MHTGDSRHLIVRDPVRVSAIGHNMVNFGPPNTVAEECKDRKFYQRHPPVTLFDGVRETHRAVELVELDYHINDVSFAEATARRLLELIEKCEIDGKHGCHDLGVFDKVASSLALKVLRHVRPSAKAKSSTTPAKAMLAS